MSDEECATCAEGGYPEGECPLSQRVCGHHCNHVWDQDCCHWCGAEVNEDGNLIPNYVPVEWSAPTGNPIDRSWP